MDRRSSVPRTDVMLADPRLAAAQEVLDRSLVKALAAALRSGAVMSIAKNVILLPGVLDRAADVLARLPSPFTVSDARVALATSRRVVLPLLECLDAEGITRRVDNDLRVCRPQGR
ncbi:SelB C-terminal domain-containing protein [Streptosporangium sp. NPDC087985]|uniref:SelB domain-containing protein n=1 Tax=Streptosporangium sp. NPDC087985 TaxID=3366196 RepID=UPI00381D4BC0